MAGVREISAKSGETSESVKRVFNAVLALCKADEEVRIQGFGTFSKKHVEARVGRNPRTNEEIKIPAKDKLAFKVAKGVEMESKPVSGRRR